MDALSRVLRANSNKIGQQGARFRHEGRDQSDGIGARVPACGGRFEGDAADGDEGQGSERAGGAKAIETDHRIGAVFGLSAEYRAERDITYGLGLSGDHLFRIVCGEAEQRSRANDTARISRGEIFLAHMQTRADHRGVIGAVIDDQRRAELGAKRGDSLGFFDDLTVPKALVAILENRGASVEERAGGIDRGEAKAPERRGIEYRINGG
jgi:hypothetical protein